MPRLIGREAEITALRAAYAAATSAPAAHTLVITGAAGSGKTALTSALEDHATPAVFVLRTSALPFDRVLPFALLERLGSDLHARLERTTRERPVLVVIRDTQFADGESLASIAAYRRALADRPLFVVFTTDDDEHAATLHADTSIALHGLDARSAEELAREQYPQASQSVLDAIVANGRGMPYEIITIARAARRRGTTNPEAVDLSSGAAIAKELAALPSQQRSGLQLLSLLSEPDEPGLYGIEPIEGLQLDHALTSAAVLETIAMKIPLRRRIISALERRGARTLRERLVLAEQVFASGDRALAQRVLLDLAFVAAAERASRAVVWAAERHLEIGEPPDDRLIDFYSNFFAALMDTHAFTRAESVAAHALSEAQHRGLRGLGSLAAHLVQAQWSVERPEAARASYERYAHALEDPHDLELLREAAPWLNAV